MASPLTDILAKVTGLDAKLEKLSALQGNAEALAEIPGLKSQVASLTADLTGARAESETLRGQLSAALTAKEASDKSAADAVASASALKTEVDALKAKDKTAAAKAVDIMAGLGVAPIADGKKAASQTVSRSVFNAMSAPEQSAFCIKGGRITN
jgi:seryl-tRNA synthetase